MQRRRLLAGVSGVGVAVLSGGLVGCGSAKKASAPPSSAATASASSAAATPAPKRGGRYLNVFEGYVGSMDAQLGSTPYQVTAYMGDPLLGLDNMTRQVSPGIVAKWEQPDPTTVVLTIRPGVKFFNLPPANGRDVTANDVVYMLKSWNGSLYPDAKIPFPRKSLLDSVADITAVDNATVKLTTTAPRSDLITALAEQRTAVLPEGLREHFGGITSLSAPDKAHLVGTGPFIADSIDPQGQALWKRNPDYWRPGQPYLDEVQTNIITDQTAWVTAFVSKQNYELDGITPATYAIIKNGVPNAQLVTSTGSTAFKHIGVNTRAKPLDDVRVRTALALIFDKPAVGNAIYGTIQGNKLALYAGPLSHTFPEALPQADLASLPGMRSPTADDIANAKKLVAAAGISDANPVSLAITTPVEQLGVLQFKLAAEHLVDQTSKYLPGLKVTIDATDYTSMLAKIGNPASGFQLYIGNWLNEPSAVGMLSVVYRSTGGRNFTGFKDQQTDDFIASAYTEFDAAKRLPILHSAQSRVMQNWAHIPIDQGRSVSAIQPFVENLRLDHVGVSQMAIRDAWLSTS